MGNCIHGDWPESLLFANYPSDPSRINFIANAFRELHQLFIVIVNVNKYCVSVCQNFLGQSLDQYSTYAFATLIRKNMKLP